MRFGSRTAAAVLMAGGGGSVLAAWMWDVPLAAWQPSVKAAMTGITVVAVLVAASVLAHRFSETRTARDALFALGLALLGLLALGVGFLAPLLAVDGQGDTALVAWRVWGRAVGVALLAGAAWLPARPASRTAVAVSAGVAVLVGVPVLGGAAGASGMLVGLLVLLVAGLVRHGDAGDPLQRWMTWGMGVAAVGVLLVLAQPPAGIDWLHAGDVFWLAASLCLLVGATQAYRAAGEAAAARAAAEQRQQLAETLHDGLAQELALVTSQCRWLSQRTGPGHDELELVAAASTRALEESRRAIEALRSTNGHSAPAREDGDSAPPSASGA